VKSESRKNERKKTSFGGRVTYSLEIGRPTKTEEKGASSA